MSRCIGVSTYFFRSSSNSENPCPSDGPKDSPSDDYDPDKLHAELHIRPEGHLDIKPFAPPTYVSPMPMRLKAHGKSEIEVTFLGDGFLHLVIDLNLVMKSKPAAVREGVDGQKLEFWGYGRVTRHGGKHGRRCGAAVASHRHAKAMAQLRGGVS